MSDRHTADTITDDALDQLYAQLDELHQEIAAAGTALADMARKRNEQMDRADRAEADRKTLGQTALGYQQRAWDAEAAIRRVRAVLADPAALDWRQRTREALDGPAPAATEATTGHVYLSTGCLHGHHDYCQNHTGHSGAKTPAQCKFCAAPCTCHCHTTAGAQR
ncbi:hypothetical protein [Streptomyces albogriseolus]|uniref:hypothetical protein n=1 Tax=Streptomyces albogriseolus TaxID=1887 RepID=UPI0036AB007C